jgi:hypothetical protein
LHNVLQCERAFWLSCANGGAHNKAEPSSVKMIL